MLNKNLRRSISLCSLVALLLLLAAPPARAVPVLQLWIEGSTFNSFTQTWDFVGDNFKLWVLGDVGSYGTIFGVKLTAAFPSSESGTTSLTPTTASPAFLPAPGDPSTSGAPSLVGTPLSALNPPGPCGTNGTDGTIPCLGDGSVLPSHAEYGTGVQWKEFLLGDFTLTDSPIDDFTTSVPNPSDPTQFTKTGQINAYDVSVSGFTPGTTIHFDAFNHIVLNNNKIKFVFAPFSHDAQDTPRVPAPPSLLLLGGGLAGLAGVGRIIRGKQG